MRQWGLLAGLALTVAPASAEAACSVAKFAELPVTMQGRRPLVPADFGDRHASFMLDSGAFYSTVSRASATEFGLDIKSLPDWFRLRGVGGETSASVGTARNFKLAGQNLPKVQFVVGGSDTGTTGLLGQNILGLRDVEYDLAHGAVRLMQVKDCGNVSLAYWAGERPVTMLKLEGVTDQFGFKPHTIATVTVNGVKMRAIFDTGADSTVMTPAAARRAGIDPTKAKVEDLGFTSGIGTRYVRAYRATFDKIELGGEAIGHPVIDIGELGDLGADMLVGIDFFLTHRIFVSNTNRVMYFTYEGGPVFGQGTRNARTAAGAKLDLTDRTAAPTDAEGFSRRGAAYASTGKLDLAAADFDRAVALAPKDGRYLQQRALLRLEQKKVKEAKADLDQAVALMPNDAELRLQRAAMRLAEDDRAGAAEDAHAADAALAPSNDKRAQLASLYIDLDQPDAAVANLDKWLAVHREDSGRANALNSRCWARAIAGTQLDRALADCNASLRARPGMPSVLDSRALVRLKRGELKAAIADYDAALKANPDMAWSLYARSVAYQRTGDAALAKRDRTAALKLDPDVTQLAKRYGLND